MVPATTTQRQSHRECRVCHENIYSGDIAYKTTLQAPQLSKLGRVHYWTCVKCQRQIDGVLALAERGRAMVHG